ncbi:ABC transporter permease [Acrocarpospora catenulata]|uniref:ABC transporter permease n=1 Tax=Acrocarpospora catenulata TaxID=2836182 RepID=UPI001BD9D363|nr:FtsX-like permease family protein [Acrocarpospora catenulata]
MLRTTLAGLLAHKLRLLLTSLAITLGVGFIGGTFVLTDTIEVGFQQKFTADAEKVDVAVRSKEDDEIPAELLAKIRAVPGVTDAQGLLGGPAPLLGRNGKAVGNVPTTGISIATGTLARTTVTSGVGPTRPTDAILDENTAKTRQFAIGDTITVLDPEGGKHDFTLVGLFDVGVDQWLAYTGAVGFTAETAQRMTAAKGYREINIAGPNPESLRDAVAALTGPGYRVQTGTELADELARASNIEAGYFRLFLLIFGLIAMFVAALVIYNTFNILVAQRTREMALLRCIGATRTQVFGSIVIESVVVAVLSSALGLVVGLGLGAGALAVLGQLGAPMPTDAPISLKPLTIVVSLLVGMVVTVGAALFPARAATRVPPVAALRSQLEEPTFRAGLVRMIFAGLFLLAGAAVTAIGVTMENGDTALVAVVAGGAVTFLGVLVVSPVLMRPLAAVAGWLPRRLFGVPGRLAVDNSQRNPKRAATTTVALTIGVTLMTLISVVTSTTRESVQAQLDKQFPVDFIVTDQRGPEGSGLPSALAAALRQSPELGTVIETQLTTAKLNGQERVVMNLPSGPETRPTVTEGSFDALTPGTIAVGKQLASAKKLKLGDTVPLATTEAGTVNVRLTALFDEEDVDQAQAILPEADFKRYFGSPGAAAVYVSAKHGVATDVARRAVEAVALPYPTAQVASAAEIRGEFDEALDMVLMIFGGLLGLAVLISILGIANTLSLSVHERTHESALVRALGLTRGQLRGMLSLEALVLGLIGALIGVVLGTVFGWAAMKSMPIETTFTVPAGQILLLIALSGLAGVLAATLPARRAARASIVDALAAA